MKLEVGQELIRTTKAGVDTCTVVCFRHTNDPSIYLGSNNGFNNLVELSNGERVDPEGWYFDPANPSAWRVVEKPEPAKVRTIDEVFDAIVDLVVAIGHNEGGLAADDPEVETLRAELKALVESLIEEAREDGAEHERLLNSEDE